MTTVMVIDDEAIIREPIEAVLRHAGYQALSASDSKQALALTAKNRPDLILLDIAMPMSDGLALLRTLRRDSTLKTVPVIVLTAMADKARVLEAGKLGVCAYMLKTRFSLSELLEQIRKHAPLEASTSSMTAAGVTPATSGSATTAGNSAPPHVKAASPVVADVIPPASTRPLPPATASQFETQADALRSLKPIITRSDLSARMENCVELRGFSPAVAEVLKLTSDPRCSIEQVAKAISADHAIALKVLKLCNSAVYTRGEPVDSVLKAVMRIGLSQIRQVVLNIAVIDRFTGEGIQGFVESGQFWEHAIATGIIAAEIAHARDEKHADAAFTTGLLHDVGRMVYVAQLGDLYRQVLEAARDMQLPLEQVEHRMLCFNHADVMDQVFRRWKFSKHLIKPIVFHHLSAGNIRSAAPQETMEVATLGLANRLAHAFMLGSSGNQAIYPTEELCELLKLDRSVIAHIEKTAREETEKVKLAMLASSNLANWVPMREQLRTLLVEPMRPVYVSSTPQIDGLRIFFEQLALHENGQPPNLGVISLRNARERIELSAAYASAEAQAGAANLPLLIISPSGSIMPEHSLLAGRQYQCTSTPLVIPRLMQSLNSLLAPAQSQQVKKAA